LSEGIHTMRIEVVDKAGNMMNIGEYTFTIDTTAPTVMINLPEEGFTYPMGIVNCSGTFSEVCSSVSGTVVPNPVEGDYTPGSVSLTNWNYPTSPLSTGTYTLSVKAVDLAGNMSVPVTRMFLVE
ncbi:MAG TPA: Ig-like domain repeat protein, partial [Treponemataceae bacterium]|nr:Ig-like domain repeat protein [Treponemataceae bacterium]